MEEKIYAYLVNDSQVRVYAPNRWDAYEQAKKMGFGNVILRRVSVHAETQLN